MDTGLDTGKQVTEMRISSSQLATLIKDLRVAKTVKMDLEAGMTGMALDTLKSRRMSEENTSERKRGWYNDAIAAICTHEIPKAIIIVADVAWIRQAELNMLTNEGKG